MKDCLKIWNKLPLVSHRFRNRAPRLRFLDLPEDIVYEIIGHLSVRSLCNLSVTCHRLYLSLLLPHLQHQGIENPFTEIHLNGDNCTDALPALRLLRFSNRVGTLTWRAGRDAKALVREVEQLRRLIIRIPSIDYLELDFSNSWPSNEFRHSHENGYWSWIRVCTNLLHVVAQKCHFVVITNHYQVLVPWLTFIGGIPSNLDRCLLDSICEQWREESKTMRLKSPSKISLTHPHASRLPAFTSSFPSGRLTPGYTTTRIIINDPGLFQHSLFGEWAINWVNKMPLTHLVVHQGRMRLPLLRQLLLPELVHLTISHGYGLSTSDIILVLQNNESLTSVECHDTKLDVSGDVIMLKKGKQKRPIADIGISLERIKGCSPFICRMLDLELAFLHLTTIAVQLRGDAANPNEQASLHRLYRAVSVRRTIVTLVFEFPPLCEKRGGPRLQSWLWSALCPENVKATSEVLRSLDCIRSVQIRSQTGVQHHSLLAPPLPGLEEHDGNPLSDSASPHLLSSWISLFPSLEEITFARVFDPKEPASSRSVVASIIKHSPRVMIRVDGALCHPSSLSVPVAKG